MIKFYTIEYAQMSIDSNGEIWMRSVDFITRLCPAYDITIVPLYPQGSGSRIPHGYANPRIRKSL